MEPYHFYVGKTEIKVKRDSHDVWNEENPVLRKGELAYDKDVRAFKRGDGETRWRDLPWYLAVVPQENQ